MSRVLEQLSFSKFPGYNFSTKSLLVHIQTGGLILPLGSKPLTNFLIKWTFNLKQRYSIFRRQKKKQLRSIVIRSLQGNNNLINQFLSI